MEKYVLSSLKDPPNVLFWYFFAHASPAMVIFGSGLWLAINIFRRYYRSQMADDQQLFRCQLWYAGPFTKKVPLDSVVRGAISIPLFISFALGIIEKQKVHLENMQHAVIFFSTFFSSLLETMTCLVQYRSSSTTSSPFGLPLGVDRMATILSWAVNFFVFHFHFHNESVLSSHLHGFIGWLNATLLVTSVIEYANQQQIWLALFRPYVLFLNAQWSCQIAFILYFPIRWTNNWDDSSNLTIMTTNFLFCCHLILSFVLLMVIGIFVRHSEKVSHHHHDRPCVSEYSEKQDYSCLMSHGSDES